MKNGYYWNERTNSFYVVKGNEVTFCSGLDNESIRWVKMKPSLFRFLRGLIDYVGGL